MSRSYIAHTLPDPCCSLDITKAASRRLVTLFKALGNPIRFEILKYLVTHPGCITGDIVEVLPIAQATVSQHLKVLREAGWIMTTPDGPANCYYLSERTVSWFREKVGEIF
jgi:DNA-binding transcriptional ArsR family regulator